MKKLFSYHNNGITFLSNNGVMVNATEMAKVFGKSVHHWLQNASTQSFIDTLSRTRNSAVADLLQVKKGGLGTQGTWMHEDLAMEFARWLSPEFALWCNDRIKELLTQGYAKLESISRDDLIDLLVAEKNERLSLAEENKRLSVRNEFVEKVFESDGAISVGEAAKVMGTGQNRLFEMMRNAGIMQKGNKVPYQRFIEAGFFEVKVSHYRDHVNTKTLVTPRGVGYLMKRLGFLDDAIV